jgi:hypothetical protein
MRSSDIPLIRRLESLGTPTLENLHHAVFADRNILQDLQLYIENIAAPDIYALNCANRVEDVQPTNFVLYSQRGRFEVVVNHFIADLFAKSRNAPHFHHCSFATRVLCGSYHHVVYNNTASQAEPKLSVRGIKKIGPGEGYSIEWHTYHAILRPEDNTLTLLLRGPQCHSRPNLSTKDYPLEIFAAEFATMRGTLSRAVALEGV